MATADLVVRVLADTSKIDKALDSTASRSSKFAGGIQKAALPAAAALAGIGAAAISAGNAAAEDAQSQAILAKTLKSTTGAHDAQVAAVEKQIDAMSRATGVADDELRPAMGNLLRATGDASKSQDALALALDVSAATGASVESVSKAMAKGFGGSAASLKKLLPTLDETSVKTADMDSIMQQMTDSMGGSAAAAADTAAGKMKIMQVSMAEAQETLGTALLPAMSTFANVLADVANWVGKNTKLVGILVGIVAGLAIAGLAVNAALKVYRATLIVIQVVQKATFLTNPIFLVVAAILLIVAAVVLLWKRSETFRAIVLAVWDAVKSAAKTVATAITNFFVAAWDKITETAKAVGRFVQNIWDKIKSGADTVVSALKTAWSGLEAILTAPFDALLSAVDFVKGKIDDLLGLIGKIHLPHIDLPGPFGLSVPGVGSFSAPRVSTASTRSSTPSGTTVVVNGALDPEAVARQIGRILGGHNRRVGLAP